MKLLNTGITDLLIVDVPTSATGFDILPDRLSFDYMEDDIRMPDYIPIPEGYKYTVLGKVSELTEEQCDLIVPKIDIDDPTCGFERFMTDDEFARHDRVEACSTATESFHSLLKANGILLDNPLGKKPIRTTPFMNDGYYSDLDRVEIDAYNAELKDWQEAQSKVSNPLIIKAEKV